MPDFSKKSRFFEKRAAPASKNPPFAHQKRRKLFNSFLAILELQKWPEVAPKFENFRSKEH